MNLPEVSVLEIPDTIDLPAEGGVKKRVHKFESRDIWAIRAALGAGRPLLVRGEPGLGKTQLAEAAAVVLERRLITCVVNARTEAGDLLYSMDAVRRLAEAQLCSLLQTGKGEQGAAPADLTTVRDGLKAENFLVPGPIWWALNPRSAAQQAEKAKVPHLVSPLDGVTSPSADMGKSYPGRVLLIDEIDKAESEVPNSLLEVLGSRKFTVPGMAEPVTGDEQAPLIVITTNEERALPDAFLRRCVVLHLALPGKFDRDGKNPELQQWLVARGRVHFSGGQLTDKVLREAAEALLRGRSDALKQALTPVPGQAEYLDLLRAVSSFYSGASREAEQLQSIRDVSQFLFRKYSLLTGHDSMDGDSP